jgi:hypothetical protein
LRGLTGRSRRIRIPGPGRTCSWCSASATIARRPRRASQPQWLTIPERGLYTGVIIVGAIGTGKTSACMYPYLEQLLAYRAGDPARRVGGLVLEVKGDFCAHVRDILARHGRADDYVEISLTSVYRYNPLHNDLDAYALAYGIATLMTNLFGRGKEPFWQQASTNLVKFVILLHQVLDDYVTLFQVYEHVINPDKLRARIADGERRFASDGRRLIVDSRAIHARPELEAWGWQPLAGDEGWTPGATSAERHARRAARDLPHRGPSGCPGRGTRREQFAAVKRWFEDDWMRIEPKLRTSIVEGVSVFLSLFDDNPQVKHTFCPPKATYDPLGESRRAARRPAPADHRAHRAGEGHRAQLPGRHESRAGAGARHDAETGLPAGRARPGGADERGARPRLAPRRVPLR